MSISLNTKWTKGTDNGYGKLETVDGYKNKIIIVVAWKDWYWFNFKNKWLDGYLNGEGSYTHPDGSYYKGEWKNS